MFLMMLMSISARLQKEPNECSYIP